MKPFLFVPVCLLVICLTTPSSGQTELSNTPVKRKESVVQVSKERKEQLLAFVDANHPELKELLEKLENRKKQRPYHQAMSWLDKSVKKLDGIKKRSPKRYESSLSQWNLESRIKVAAAQVKLNDTEESRSKLKSLVTQLVDFHIERMKADRAQILKRLKQTENRISEAESSREQAIEKRILKVTTQRGKK